MLLKLLATISVADDKPQLEYELHLKLFYDLEDSTKRLRETRGDAAYLLEIVSTKRIESESSSYSLLGDHPEIHPPGTDVGNIGSSAELSLEAAREYLQRNYLDLWAGVYWLSGEESENKPRYSKTLLRNMGNIYTEDLYIQERVEEFSEKYAEDETELFEGITGRELIEHMREHLPDPDPRALEAYRKKRDSNAIHGSRNSEPKRHGGSPTEHRPVGNGRNAEGKSGYIWLVVALFALIGGGTVLLFSKARQS